MELSTDQKYLFIARNAVIFGKNKLDQGTLRFLQRSSPGTIHHARWLTTANRMLRLYMSLEDPPNNLCRLIIYIVKVYSKSWFRLKQDWKCVQGAKNFFFILHCLQSLSFEDTKLEARVALQRNCYFAHPESILLAEIVDSDEKIANDALMNILEARKANDVSSLRVFSKQGIPLNFGTTSYYFDMIEWSSVEISLPPILQNMTMQSYQSELLKKH